MRNAARLALLLGFAFAAACGGGDGNGPSDPVPTSLAISAGNNQSATVATVVPVAPQVTVEDQRGNGIPGITVTFAVASGGGSITGGTVVTGQGGTAAVGSWTLGTAAGANTLSATVVGLAPVTITATATAGAPASLVFITPPASTAASGVILAPAPSVQAKDLFGNNTAQAGFMVTVAIATGGGTLGGTASVATNASGVATFANLTITGTVGPRTLSFSGTGVPALLSGTIQLTSGVPATLAAATPTTLAGTVGAAVGSPITVTATDQSGTPVEGAQVSFAVTAGGGSVTGGAQITDASGQATLGSWTLGTTAGTLNTVAATLGALPPVVFSSTPVAAAASQLLIVTEPGTVSAVNGAVLNPQPAIQVADPFGNPVAQVIAVTASIASGGGALNGTTGVSTAADGSLSFTNLSVLGLTGARTLGFSAAGLTAATSASFTVTTGPATTMALSAGDGQSATAGSAVAVLPAVLITDQSGNPVAGASVSFAVASGGGSVTGGTASTAANGIATVGSWTLGNTAGANTLTATAAGLSGSPVTFTATGTPGPASALSLVTAPSSTATNGVALAQQPAVQLRDQFGNAVSQAGIVITSSVSSGGGSVAGSTTATTNAGGLATFSGLILNGPVGIPQVLSFSASGLTSVASGNITMVAGAAALLEITTQPSSSAQNGVTFAQQPVLQVTDVGGNPVSVAALTVTAVIGSGGGTLGGTTAVATNGSGAASFTNLSITGLVGSRTLDFSASGLTGATSGSIAITAGAATTIAAASPTSQTALVGTAVANPPAVLVTDPSGNPIGGVSVTFAVTSGGGNVTGGSASTGTDGIATVGSWTLGSIAGINTLDASSGVLTGSPVTFSATGTASAITQLAIITQPSATAANGAVLVQQPVVELRDAFDNPVPAAGVSVTAAVSVGGTLAGTTSISTDAGGQASFTNLALSGLVGNYTLSFSATGLTGATSTSIALGVGAAASIALNAGDNQTATVNTAVAVAPSVLVRDAGTNPVSGVSVSFAVTLGSGSVGGGAATTNASGIATVGSWTLGTVAGSNILSATSTGLSGSPVSFSATGVAGAAASVVAQSVTTQNGRMGIAATAPPAVLVQDGFGNPASGVSVTFAVTAGGGSVTGGSQTTNGLGIATVPAWTFGKTVVTNTVTATAGALPTVNFDATVTFEVASVSSGNDHTCALTIDGVAFCWGNNGAGGLGNGTTTDHPAPVAVSSTTFYSAISAGRGFSCGFDATGAARCWGINSFGELGTGNTSPSTTPAVVTGGASFVQLATEFIGSSHHSCGVTGSSALLCWGDNSQGQFGRPAPSSSSSPVASGGIGSSYLQVSAGDKFSCGVRTGGAGFCWGLNGFGQLGDSTRTQQTTPVAVKKGLSFTHIVAGQVSACGLTTAATVFCWGDNGNGRLGRDTFDFGTPPPPAPRDTLPFASLVPVQVPGLSNVVQLVGGAGHVCARTSTDQVLCWGLNESGQVGDGSTSNRTIPTAISLPLGVTGFTFISAGAAFTCGVTAANDLYCWGEGGGGQLGNGLIFDQPLPTLVIDP